MRSRATCAPTPDFILDQPPYHFAAFVRGVTDSAVSIRIPATDMNAMPRMTAGEHDLVRERIREKYAACRDTPRPAATAADATPEAPAQPVAPEPASPLADDWRS